MVSCGEDKLWMIWKVDAKSYENKGMISGFHSRPIYTCSWAKTRLSSNQDDKTDLIATVRNKTEMLSYNITFIREVQITKLLCMKSAEIHFQAKTLPALLILMCSLKRYESLFNILQPQAHENDINSVVFHPSDSSILASCSDDGKIKIWKVQGEDQVNCLPSDEKQSNNGEDFKMQE